MRLKINQPDMNPRSVEVWLDGVDITGHLMSATIQWAADDVTTATIKIAPDGIDIDAETAARLHAIADASSQAQEAPGA